MCRKGPKMGPFRSLFATFLVTRVCQIDYKAIEMVACGVSQQFISKNYPN